MPIITAYRVDTGQPVSIPHHWLGHPVLGASFTAEPHTLDVKSAIDYDDQYENESDYLNPEEGDTDAIHTI